MAVFLLSISESVASVGAQATRALEAASSRIGALSDVSLMRTWRTPSPRPDYVVVSAPELAAVTGPLDQMGVNVVGSVELLPGPDDEGSAENLYSTVLPDTAPEWVPVLDGIEGPWPRCPVHGYAHPPPLHYAS